MAIGSAMLIDFVGRRRLFIISNSGMLSGKWSPHSVFFSGFWSNGEYVVFLLWTLATALYNTSGQSVAAIGKCFRAFYKFWGWFVNLHTFFYESDAAIIPLIFLFFAFYDLAYTPMLVAYTLEILPFRIRAKGFAVMVNFFLMIPWQFFFFLRVAHLCVVFSEFGDNSDSRL